MKNLSLHPSNSPMLSEMLFAFLPRASNTSYKWPLCSILDIAILHMFFTNGYHIGMINKWLVYIHENVEPILSLVLRSKGSGIAQVVETSNAESPTPVYVYRKHS